MNHVCTNISILYTMCVGYLVDMLNQTWIWMILITALLLCRSCLHNWVHLKWVWQLQLWVYYVVFILIVTECQKDYWLEVIIGVCVGVLLLGILALIIWKRIVTLHDSREFAKFEKEAQQARWKSVSILYSKSIGPSIFEVNQTSSNFLTLSNFNWRKVFY